MTLIGFAFKIAAAPFHLVGARRLRRCADSERGIYRFSFKSRVVRCSWKNHARRVCAEHRQRRLARGGCRMGADCRGPRGIFDLVRQLRRARAKKRAPSPRLFRRRARRLQFDGTRHRQSRRIFRHSVLQHGLRVHACRCVLRSRTGAARDRRRRLAKFRRPAHTIAIARRLHGDLFAFTGGASAARRIFRKILSLQCCAAGQ